MSERYYFSKKLLDKELVFFALYQQPWLIPSYTNQQSLRTALIKTAITRKTPLSTPCDINLTESWRNHCSCQSACDQKVLSHNRHRNSKSNDNNLDTREGRYGSLKTITKRISVQQ
jgi:hypothetical protein